MDTRPIADLRNDLNIKRDWRSFSPSSLKVVKYMLIAKHGNLTNARIRLGFNNASALSDLLANRANHPAYVEKVQNDLELTDDQVLHLWPLLREWPKESRRAV